MYRVAICDDEPSFLEAISVSVKKYATEHNQPLDIRIFQHPETLRDEITDGPVFDIYLLDVEMPALNGFELARQIKAVEPSAPILFLTSHVEMSREGYKVDALRYVAKLDLDSELSEALDAALAGAQKAQASYLNVTHYHDIVRIPYDEIIYVVRVMRFLEIYTVRQGVVTTGRGVKEIFEKIGDNRFVFISRSSFVNLDHVRRLSDSEIELDTGERLPISRKMLPGVKATILKVWGERS